MILFSFVSFVLTIAVIELVFRTNFFSSLNLILNCSKKSYHLMLSSKISDHWKEKLLPYYSVMILKSSLKMLTILILIVFLGFLVDYLFKGFIDYLFSFIGFSLSLLLSISYFRLRRVLFE